MPKGAAVTDVHIPLTIEEKNLFEMFRKFVTDKKLTTTVRVAGGWVRDKIMNTIVKDDIDIAVDNMTGKEFIELFFEWSSKNGRNISKIGVIQQNPEKSKHLETATAHIGKYSVDFVNLRTENYTSSSRVPIMTFGTPAEDAMRRDLTINSLFYNINTGYVEDYTSLGLQDIRDRVVRTPLPALTTLKDDPLRILRAIRFASRFDFTLSNDIIVSAMHEDVILSLGKKVSKERILQELQLMLSHANAQHAVNMLYRLRLLQVIMELPSVEEVRRKNETDLIFSELQFIDERSKIHLSAKKFHAYGMAVLLLFIRCRSSISAASSNHMAIRMAILSSGSIGYAIKSKRKNSFRCVELAESMLTTSLKMKNKDVDLVLQLHYAARMVSRLLRRLVLAGEWNNDIRKVSYLGFDVAVYGGLNRIELGECMIRGNNHTHEAIDLAYSLLQLEILKNGDLNDAAVDTVDVEDIVEALHQATTLSAEGQQQVLSRLTNPSSVLLQDARSTMLEAIEKLQLQNCWQQQPLINGTTLKSILTNIPPGTAFGHIMDYQTQWMLANPTATAACLTNNLRLQYKDYVS